eukprot:scaffold8503_cov296-Pinguiococcus_pyrenoidosus.AAC.2
MLPYAPSFDRRDGRLQAAANYQPARAQRCNFVSVRPEVQAVCERACPAACVQLRRWWVRLKAGHFTKQVGATYGQLQGTAPS